MKILHKTPLWNLVYPLLFGFLIGNPLALFTLSIIITFHVFYLVINDIDLGEETAVYSLLSIMAIPLIIYILLVDEKIGQNPLKIRF